MKILKWLADRRTLVIVALGLGYLVGWRVAGGATTDPVECPDLSTVVAAVNMHATSITELTVSVAEKLDSLIDAIGEGDPAGHHGIR